MKTIILLIKVLSLASAGAAYTDIIPAKFLPVAALAFAGASTLKDLLVKIGDYLDDKQINGSFKG